MGKRWFPLAGKSFSTSKNEGFVSKLLLEEISEK